jgi:ubiquinone biosynthesis protein COQ9
LDFTIIVKDFETDLPIDEVTITAIKTKQGFLTNAEGKAILHLTKQSDLEFVHSSYRTYIVKFSTLNKKENVVYLEPVTQQLEEVILTREHPQEILKQLVEKSKSQLTIPINLKIYLREFYKKNDKMVYFNDGLLNFQVLGNVKNVKSDILVEQNRAVGLLDADIDANLLGYDLNNIIENYYQFNYLDEVLTNRAKKNYDFQVKTYLPNDAYLRIRIVPLDEVKGILSEFNVVYDTEKRLIMEITSVVTPSRLDELKAAFLFSSKVFKLEFRNVFRMEDGIYYLANSKEVIGFEKKFKKQNRRVEVRNHMVVTNFDKKLFQYDSHNIFKDKSLINKKTMVFSNYWDNDSGLLATAEEKAVIDYLSKTDDSD